MRILILGSGGREHALAWKLSQSQRTELIFVAPGNAGTKSLANNLEIDPSDFFGVKDAILKNNIDMVVVGPEAPLVKGIRDFLESDPELKKLRIVGPGKKGAQLEGSKDFAKQFMQRNNIPTASYATFTGTRISSAMDFLKSLKAPYVLKADGLAAGKGVLIISDYQEAVDELKLMFEGKFGDAGSKVVIEEFLEGIELSVFVVTDGKSYKILPEAKDYKRVGEGDTGLNTGGMGAVSPVRFADAGFMSRVEESVIKPTIKGLVSENIDYQGFIFFGLMNCGGDPYVIEYNVRLGDPESEVVIPRIKSDMVDLLEGVTDRNLEGKKIEIDDRFVTTVMMVSGGYPGEYEKGKPIRGLEKVSDSIVFHAGTKPVGSDVLTAGGRVIAVSSFGETMDEALRTSYRNVDIVDFEAKYSRRDIGFDLRK